MTQDVICAAPLAEEGQEEALSFFFRLLRPHREQLYAYYRGKQSVPKGETVPFPSPLSGTPPEHPAAVHDAGPLRRELLREHLRHGIAVKASRETRDLNKP